MPSCWKHCAMSKKRTGKNYKALHEWVDSKKGVNHRVVKHFFTIKLKNYVSKNFGGPEAVSEWLFHIAMDNLDTYITNQWNHNGSEINFCKFGFEDNNYIHYEEDELSSEELQEEFDDDYEEGKKTSYKKKKKKGFFLKILYGE